METSEQDRAAKHGRRPLFQRIFREHFRGTVRAIRWWGVPESEAEDVAQEVFTRVLTALPRYDPARPLVPWLRTIAYRTACDARRRHAAARDLVIHGDEEGALEVMETRSGPEVKAMAGDAARLFLDACEALSDEQREVLLMREIDELSTAEIAEALDLNPNTVHSRLARARERFEAALAKRHAEEERRHGRAHPLLAAPLLLDAARRAPDLGDVALMQARVWKKLVGSLGLGALAFTSGSMLGAIGAFVLALGAGAGALLYANVQKSAAPPVIAEGPPPLAAPPPSSSHASAPIEAPPIASAHASADERDAGPRPPDPRIEAVKLDAARAALDVGNPARAKRLLNEHARLYPKSWLADTRADLVRQADAALAAKDGGR